MQNWMEQIKTYIVRLLSHRNSNVNVDVDVDVEIDTTLRVRMYNRHI